MPEKEQAIEIPANVTSSKNTCVTFSGTLVLKDTWLFWQTMKPNT
jgi:hypothetical protein